MTIKDRTIAYDEQRALLIVITALAPCFMMGVYVFGLDMLDNMLGGCGSAVLLAWLMNRVESSRKSKQGTDDSDYAPAAAIPGVKKDMEPEFLAAIITGALIVYGLPSTIPIWIVLIGVAIAMIPGGYLVKQLQRAMKREESGYINLFERAMITAAAAQTALLVLFRSEMNTWPLNDFVETRVSPGDVATGMTPLGLLAENADLPGLSRMFIGFISGPCGEVSVAAAIIGGAYLIWKRIISPLVPACVLAAIFAASFIYYMTAGKEVAADAAGPASASSVALYMACYQLLSGGAVFGAFFLAPVIYLRKAVKLPVAAVCAAGIGVITLYMRIYGFCTEGIALPVLIMFIVSAAAEYGIRRYGKKGKGEESR